MRVLLLGGQGMAGHMLASYWSKASDHELTVTIRPGMRPPLFGGDLRSNRLPGRAAVRELDVRRFGEVERAVNEVKPDLIINATGILNRSAEQRPLDAYLVNGLLPHWLARLAEIAGARLMQISSDCVFSGDRGMYREQDPPDGTSVYARSKAMGEVLRPPHLTIRTSFIGPDDNPRGVGLLRWFLAQKGPVDGYRGVRWNGVTSLELAKACLWYAERPEITGLVHLAASRSVTKYELLLMLQRHLNKTDVTVIPCDEPRMDRTLDVTREEPIYAAPDLERMVREMCEWMSVR